ncbi:MAG: flagellar motor protein [Firmicutes bacterium]|nr:flagellar motor protein [Bacillota bacterium]
MDLATVIGLLAAVGSLLISVVVEGGSLRSLVNLSGLIVVFGGTIGATMVSFALKDLSAVGDLFRLVFSPPKTDPQKTLRLLVSFAETARREGLLSLEERIQGLDNKFLEKGIRLIVDGTDPDLIRNMLETELMLTEERHKARASIFEAAGGFAPTMGIIGTVMGLVHALGALQDVNNLGKSIAVAFTATLYGVSSANILWLPLANKLKAISKAELVEGEMMLEGMLSILHGENPRIIEEKLKVFLEPGTRRQLELAPREAGTEERVYARRETSARA